MCDGGVGVCVRRLHISETQRETERDSSPNLFLFTKRNPSQARKSSGEDIYQLEKHMRYFDHFSYFIVS